MSKPHLPKTAAGWVALIVGVAVAALTAYKASQGDWLATALGALGALGTIINRGLIGKPVASLLLVGVLVAGAGAGCNKDAAAWRTVAASQAVGNMTDKAIATATKRQIATCIGQHGKGGAQYKTCVEDSEAWKALQDWRRYAVPAVNTTNRAAVGALVIKGDHDGDDTPDKLATARAAICILAALAKKWGHLYGRWKDGIMMAIGAIKGATCK